MTTLRKMHETVLRKKLSAFFLRNLKKLRNRCGATVVLLIQSDTSTEYHAFCHAVAKEIRYLKPRVRFNNPDGTPMPGSPQVGSMVVIFQEHIGPVKTKVWEWKKDIEMKKRCENVTG